LARNDIRKVGVIFAFYHFFLCFSVQDACCKKRSGIMLALLDSFLVSAASWLSAGEVVVTAVVKKLFGPVFVTIFQLTFSGSALK